jgi:hypothetical protein
MGGLNAVEQLISSTTSPTAEQVAAAMASATTVWEVLWDAIVWLEERLTKVETELASLITEWAA